MKPSELAYGAARYLRERGWRQGPHDPQSQARCLIGALWKVSGKMEGAGARVRERLREQLDVVGLGVWNDESGRTADEVIAALERAAMSLETEEA